MLVLGLGVLIVLLIVSDLRRGFVDRVKLTRGAHPSRGSWQVVSAIANLTQLMGLYLLLVLYVDGHEVVEERLADPEALIDVCLDFLELTLAKQWPKNVLFNDCPKSLVIDILKKLVAGLVLGFKQRHCPLQIIYLLLPLVKSCPHVIDSFAVNFACV